MIQPLLRLPAPQSIHLHVHTGICSALALASAASFWAKVSRSSLMVICGCGLCVPVGGVGG